MVESELPKKRKVILLGNLVDGSELGASLFVSESLPGGVLDRRLKGCQQRHCFSGCVENAFVPVINSFPR